MTNLRTVTQNDIDRAVEAEILQFVNTQTPVDLDLVYEFVSADFTRMREKNIVDPIYDLDGMITAAIQEYV